MQGVLLVDKPTGPTSHDVVARLRRTSGQRRIGHTGTLDPMATGLLVLVLGSATRLAALLSGHDKTYDAVVRFGVSTDTDDAEGRPMDEPAAAQPRAHDVEAALAAFRGAITQRPPRHSAKKIGGERAYDLARQDREVPLKPVAVTVHSLEVTGWPAADSVALRMRVASGFYVRALARDLGLALGCGAHLAALRRTHVGPFEVDRAVALEVAEREGRDVASRVLTPADALPDLPGLQVADAAVRRVVHGNPISTQDVVEPPRAVEGSLVRLLAPDGRLLALAEPRRGSLHPVVVLG